MRITRLKKIVAQDPPADETAPEGDATDKELETLLLQVVEQNAALLAHSFVLGIALILVKANIGSKEELANLKPTILINKLRDLLRLVVAERQTLKQELRLLWRYGAERYAQRKVKEMKGVL